MAAPPELIAASGLPRHEAERLMVVATGRTRSQLLTGDGAMSEAAVRRFVDLVARRAAGEPLQHLEGTVEFGPLELTSDRRALVPRPETERLWERVVELVGDDPPAVVVDLCTGSGNLALALKHRFRTAQVVGTDRSQDALELAADNAMATGLVVEWRRGDLFDALPEDLRGRVDLLVANPPYVAAGDHARLPVDVREYEPVEALVGGERGDEVLARIAAEAATWLRSGGIVACEIGEDQGPAMLEAFAVFDPTIESDLAGRDRYVIGRLP